MKTERKSTRSSPPPKGVDDPPPAKTKKTPGDDSTFEVGSQSVDLPKQPLTGPRNNLAQVFGLNREEIKDGGLRQALGVGRPFSARISGMFRELTGLEVTKEGLTKLYEECMPGTRALVSASAKYRGEIDYSVSWIDTDGKTVARIKRRVGRDDSGAIELYSHGCFTNESHRKRALSAKVMAQETKMLRTLSDHADTRLSLWAGGMKDPTNPDDFQPIGVYVWANMGFDSAQTHGFHSRLPQGGRHRARCEHDEGRLRDLPDLGLMRKVFGLWVDQAVADGTLPDDPAIAEKLKDAADAWAATWDVSTFKVDGLTANLHVCGQPCECDIGKAFMLSGLAPRWEGVFFVNREDHPGREIADAYCRPRIEKADAGFTEVLEKALADLASDDAETRSAAIDTLGKSGASEVADRLRAFAKAQPDHADEAKQALDRIEGRHLAKGFAAQARNDRLPEGERANAVSNYLQFAEPPRLDTLKSFVRGPKSMGDFRVAREATRAIKNRNLMKPKAFFELLDGLYTAALGGGWGSMKTRDMVVEMVESSDASEAIAIQERIAAEDPDPGVAGRAAARVIIRNADEDPAAAFDLLETAITRNLERHKTARDRARSELSRGRSQLLKIAPEIKDDRMSGLLRKVLREDPFYEPSLIALEALGRIDEPAVVASEAAALFKVARNSRATRRSVMRILADLPPEVGLEKLASLVSLETDRYNLMDARRDLNRVDEEWSRAAIATIDRRLAEARR